MYRAAALVVVLVFSGSLVAAVVCGFACQLEPITVAAAACHGEHVGHDGIAAMSSDEGCDHDVAPALVMLKTAKLHITPAAFVVSAAAPGLASDSRRVIAAFEYPPGASPGTIAARSSVLRI
jgi:hypothetical protein